MQNITHRNVLKCGINAMNVSYFKFWNAKYFAGSDNIIFRVYIQNANIEIYQVKAERPLLVFLIN